MTTINRSQDNYMRTGKPNQFRVSGERGRWYVEGTDNNGVWVIAEPGVRYKTKSDARDAADNLTQTS